MPYANVFLQRKLRGPMVKTSDFESENSGSSPGGAASLEERVTNAIAAVAGTTMGCGSDRCCCGGVEAFECKTGLDIEDIARAVIEAISSPLTGPANHGTSGSIK